MTLTSPGAARGGPLAMLTAPPYSQLIRHVRCLDWEKTMFILLCISPNELSSRVGKPPARLSRAEDNAWLAQVSTALLGEPELKSVSSVFSYGNLLFTAGRRCVKCYLCLGSFHTG